MSDGGDKAMKGAVKLSWWWAFIPGAILGLVIVVPDASQGPLVWRIIVGVVGGGLAACIAFTIIAFPIAVGIDAARSQKNLLLMGSYFLYGFVGMLCIFDFLLAQGTFIVVPVLSLVGLVPW